MFVISLIPIVLSLAFIIITPLCASGAIKSNPIVGIRWPSLRASEAKWQAGHRAAIPAVMIGGILSIAAGIVFEFFPSTAPTGTVLAFVFMLAGFGVASVAATNAAKGTN